MSNQPHVQPTLGEYCEYCSDKSSVTDVVGAVHSGSIADSYFFSKLFARYGERKATEFVITSTEQYKCATMTRSPST